MSGLFFLIGLLMFTFIETPVLLMILGSIFGKPRRVTEPLLLIVSLATVFIAFIIGTWILGSILSFIVPIR